MICNEVMNTVLDYIDENIKNNISTQELAEVAAFSTQHFFRLFLSHMDMTPMKYIMRRKLYYAAKDLVQTNQKVVDIAYEYGFESCDVFTRAFKRYYGSPPNAFRRNAFRENKYCISNFAIPLLHLNQERDENEMLNKEYEVKIVTLPETFLIGIERKIGGDEWSFDVFYDVYDRVFRNASNRKYPKSPNATHGISEHQPDGSYIYFVGIEVTSLDDVPDGAVGRIMPEQLCAVIGNEDDINYKEVTDYLYGVWLEQNAYKIDFRFPAAWEYYSPNKDCEIYEERIYMPIMPMEYDIVEIPVYSGVYFRAEGETGKLQKDRAFTTMLTWAENQGLFNKGDVKFEVYWGSTKDGNVFCEVFYKTDEKLPLHEGMKRKSYPDGTYFRSSNIHHVLEPNSRAIMRYIKQSNDISFSDSGEPDYRPYFEEFRFNRKKPKLDLYTPLDVYICVKGCGQ